MYSFHRVPIKKQGAAILKNPCKVVPSQERGGGVTQLVNFNDFFSRICAGPEAGRFCYGIGNFCYVIGNFSLVC